MSAPAVIAATDPLADLTQEIADLRAQVEDYEARLDYMERFLPVDTFQSIEGATADMSTEINSRVQWADGIELTVLDASLIAGQSKIKLLLDWANPEA